MAKKVYAIKEGFDAINKVKIENKIVNTWSECLSYVKGVKGAKYKSFESLEEAKEYLKDDKKLLKKGVDSYPMDCMHIYVDGSYNVSSEKFSYGLVAVKNDVILYVENGSAEDNSQKQLRQICGELKAATRALEYIVELNEKKIVIFHDYEGIFHHAVGTWDRKDESSKKYYEFMNSMIETNGLEVVFVKIDSHTGDIYNEIADSYAKLSAEMTLTSAVDKWISTNVLKVIDEEMKLNIQRIVSSKLHGNIIVAGNTIGEREQSKLNSDNICNSNGVPNSILDKLKLLKSSNEQARIRYLAEIDESVKDKLILELLKNM